MSDDQRKPQRVDKVSMSVPRNKAHLKILERLRKLAEKTDRSLNYLAVEAIREYLEREEGEA